MKLKLTIIGLIALCMADVITSIPANTNKNNTAAKISKKTKNNKKNKQDPKDFVTIILHQATTTKDPFIQDVETLAPKGERRGVKIRVKKGGIKNTAEQLGQNLRKQIRNIGFGADRRQGNGENDGRRRLNFNNRGVKQVGIQVVRKRTTLILPRPLPSADEDYLVYSTGEQPLYDSYGGSNVNPVTPFPNHLNPFDPRLTTSFQFDYRNSKTEGTNYEYP